MVKRLPAVQETGVQSLGWEDPLEKEMATHSSTLAWKIPWTEEPGRLQSMGLQRVRHDWATSLHFTSCISKAFGFWATFSRSKSQNYQDNSSLLGDMHACVCMLRDFSHVHLFATLWAVAHQAPLSMGILEWVAMPSSRGSSRPRDGTHISYVSCIGRWLL